MHHQRRFVGLVLLAPMMMAMLRTLVLRSGRDVPVARLATVIRVLVLLLVVLVLLLHRRSTCAKVRFLESVERRLPETAAVPRTLQSRGGGGAQRSVSALR